MNTPGQSSSAIIPDRPLDSRALLTQLYWSAVKAVAPGAALKAALDRLPPGATRPRVWVIAVGKAAHPMAIAAVEVLERQQLEPAGGVIVAPRVLPSPHSAIESVAGDHPVPTARSVTAAERIGSIVARVKPDDEVWVLLSGGASSLMAAPHGEIKPEELFELYTHLLGSGLDIAAMNLIRKRFSRWGAGRLAAALAPARVRNFIISDVIGDDHAAIGSGPCVPDPSTSRDIRIRLTEAALWDRIPQAMQRYIQAVEEEPSLETPKPGTDVFANVERKVVASNRVAIDAIAARAKDFGYEPRILSTALAGEAAAVGRRLANSLLSYCGASGSTPAGRSGRTCLIWGGETTVTLGAGTTGVGGRCQELALAAARELSGAESDGGATLLAAGTDGRDGATDAAGAIVDAGTWEAIRHSGRDPERDLAEHNSHPSLDAAGALLRTDLTATNVMDVVVGICGPPAPAGA
jgi:glycerate 2-kinase